MGIHPSEWWDRQQRCGDQQAVGDNRNHIRCPITEHIRLALQVQGSAHLDAGFFCMHLHRTRSQTSSPTSRCIRSSDNTHHLVAGFFQCLKGRDSYVGSAGENDAHSVTAIERAVDGG